MVDPQTERLQPTVAIKQKAPHESTVQELFKIGYTEMVDPQTERLQPKVAIKQTAPHESIVQLNGHNVWFFNE